MILKRQKPPIQLRVTTFFSVGRGNAKERNKNKPEVTSIDSIPANDNRITSIGTRRQRAQLTPEEMKSNAERPGQYRGVHNVFNGFNHSIVAVTHNYCKTDPKSECE